MDFPFALGLVFWGLGCSMVWRFWGGQGWGWAAGSGLAVGVYAGLLLSAFIAVCMSRIFSLSLLATVRGGTSFLCPKRQRNEAKKALANHGRVSVPSVQARSFLAPDSTVLARLADV
ncbi:hypothetical protein, partial [Caballeronia mineralivorans]|jgi:hypothetical protein|uniref:hypothetical protein n=3 Tax=Caballeronia mineralivorans TaxID=2010198 RepID=UPI002AFEFC12